MQILGITLSDKKETKKKNNEDLELRMSHTNSLK